MGHSRQAYYQDQQRHAQRESRAQAVVELVRDRRIRQPRLGTRKLHHVMREQLAHQGIGLGRDALFDVLRNARMLVPPQAGVSQDHRQPSPVSPPSEFAQGGGAADAGYGQRAGMGG